MNITQQELRDQWKQQVNDVKRQQLRDAINHVNADHISIALLEAIASRETNMHNIVGDGGHGRGWFQLDDRFQQTFLRSHQGCDPGTNVPIYDSALPAGRVPTIFAGAVRACEILEANIAAAVAHGIPADGSQTRFAVAAYNCGLSNALDGWRRGDVDLNTAHGDYSSDVRDRFHILRDLEASL